MDLTKPPKHLTGPVKRALRAMVPGKLLIEQILDIDQQLQEGYKPIKDAETGQVVMQRLDKDDVTRLSASATLKLRLLAKVLPDLKQVEIQDSSGELRATPRPMSDMELAARLVHYMRKKRQLEEIPSWAE